MIGTCKPKIRKTRALNRISSTVNFETWQWQLPQMQDYWGLRIFGLATAKYRIPSSLLPFYTPSSVVHELLIEARIWHNGRR